MKTPREIILERHRAAAAKLEAIRPEQLAAMAKSPQGFGVQQSCTALTESPQNLKPDSFSRRATTFLSSLRAFPINFWHQSILPWRHVWAGMAAVWLGILTLNLVAGGSPRSASAQTARANPQVMAALHEQKDLLTQLLGPVVESSASHPKIPGPRSEQRHELFIA